jgi:hypothetical protein
MSFEENLISTTHKILGSENLASDRVPSGSLRLGRDILNHTSAVAFMVLNGLSVFSLKK